MEVLPPSISYSDDDQRNLEQLLETFGSIVSLEDIASAYCQAGRNVDTAGELLCNLQRSTSSTSSFAPKDEMEGASTSSDFSSKNMLVNPLAEGNSKLSKAKKCSASMGTVSGVIGRQYGRQKLLTDQSCKVTKPLKLNSVELTTSEIRGEKLSPDTMTVRETMTKDVEEFLFTMLGDGFSLGMDVIQEVLGLCGYDIEKSVERLLDLSASKLEKNNEVLSMAAQKSMEKCPDIKSLPCHSQETMQCIDSSQNRKARSMTKNELDLPNGVKDRYDLQKEVLEALFNISKRFEEEPIRTFPGKEARRSRSFGQVVLEPLRHTSTLHSMDTAKPQIAEEENEETEDSYEVLRKAVKEYWVPMKEYYKAAVDAFVKGNHDQAYKLLESGHFFMNRAREANEKSAQKLLETRDEEEEVSLDLHDHTPKEALRLLKLHLISLSGIPSIQYFKLIVGANDEDTKEGARKRLIIKLLERESIKWTEEGNGRVIVIRVDKINPKHLSFAEKPGTDCNA
ncbi:unnamed protein product [Ilex paraguariensis]|uniref:DUF1771 domain-containing protein n=1 Tax=Ilex paraguariensis TaxID=185542 RepID=A0ABC8R6J3_9AQUA